MLSVLTTQGYIALEHRENFSIVYDYEGEQKLSFDISPLDTAYKGLHENTKILYKDNIYLINKVNKRKSIASIEAGLNLNDWKKRIHQQFKSENTLFSELMLLVKPEGWIIEIMGVSKNRNTIDLEGCSDYEILMECKKIFGIVYEFHTREKKIKVIDPSTIQQRGLYMSDELNLDSVEYKGDSSNYANRLYAYGKKTESKQDDGSTTTSYVTIASVNQGKEYVDYRTDEKEEIISAYWQDNAYEDPQELFIAAREKIKGLASAVQSWSCNLYDLSRSNDLYRMLDFKLYDKPVLLLDGKAILHQIVEYTEYPDNQNLNKVVLSTTFKKIQGELTTIKTNMDGLESSLNYTENTVNELRRDVKSNSALIENTYRKEDVDYRLSSILQQTDESISVSVGAVEEKLQVIEKAKRYHIEIQSSKGTVFKNNLISTVLSAKIYSWDTDMTSIVTDTSVTWRRYSANTSLDQAWIKTGKSITITPEDFSEYAVFECQWNTITEKISLVVVYDGEAGVAGVNGEDGKTTYFHVKYAPVLNPSDSQLKEEPDKFIGTYVDEFPNDSELAGMYKWAQFQGDNGIAGTNGVNGKTSFLHIRYSNDVGQNFTSNNGKVPGDYLGQYTDFIEADSNQVSSYNWMKIKGEQGLLGPKGTDGKQYYTWLKYADTPTSGMSDLPVNKTYMGLAYNKESAVESSNYSDYTWSLIKGDKGEQGVTGPKGVDGKQLYTWIKYAIDNKGTGLSDDPAGKLYIGLAYNKTTATESTIASEYTWSLIKGEKGDQGERGLQGIQGTQGLQGIQGPKGNDGKSTYFHIKYAPVSTPTSAQLSETPNVFIGTYVDTIETDSTDPTKYTWSRFQGLQGEQGTQGIPGKNGADGTTSYLHIKYSNDGGKTFTANSGETAGSYIGVCTDGNLNDPTSVGAYTWSLIKGEKGDQGLSGIGVSKVEAYYYLSTSNTTQVGGSWITTSPTWADGKYIWQKTKTTLTNGTFSESTPICVTGGKGQTGGIGATGKGVSSISAEYYLSTSKTTQSGGSWVTTSPVWVIGKYIWTRSKIVYTDGSTTYTIPLCDSSWEAINDIEIGGRNLLLKSGSLVSNKTYNISSYNLGDIKPKEGDECTITIKGALGDGKTYFGCYNSGGNISMVGIYPSDFKDGIASKTFTWKITVGSVVAANTQLTVYAMPSTATTESTIEWIRLDFGNKAPRIWTPAPEDISNEIDDSETRITETYQALIDVTKKEIDLSVESITTKVNATEEQVLGLQNQLEITNEMTSFIKTTTESLKNTVDGKVDETKIKEWARFNGSSLELGASNSPFKAILSNTELAFWQGNTKVAWISNNELHIANSVIMEILKVGNWQCRDEGSAGLTWRRV